MKKLFLIQYFIHFCLCCFANEAIYSMPDLSPPQQVDVALFVKKPCYNESNGSIDVVIQDRGVLQYDLRCYKVENGAKTLIVEKLDFTYDEVMYPNIEDIYGLPKGDYLIEINNETCGYADMRLQVTESDEITIPDPVIENDCVTQGSITFTYGISGRDRPYTYEWSNGASTLNQERLLSGIYTLTVTNVNGCTSSKNFTIDDNQTLHIPPAEILTNCEYGTHIKINIDPSLYTSIHWFEKTKTFDIPLTAFDNKNILTKLKALSTFRYVVEKSGCVYESEITNGHDTIHSMIINEASVENVTCNGTTALVYFTPSVVSGGTNPYFYEWSNGETTPSLYNLAIGDYSLTVTDANGCEASKTIGVYPSLPQYPAGITKSCKNSPTGTLEMYADPINGENPIFAWTVPFTQLENSCTLENLGVGQYCVTITYPTNNCTFDKCYDILAKDPDPIVAMASIKHTCAGQSNGSITMNVTGGTVGYFYEWSTGYTSSINNYIKNLAAGNYSVTVSDNCGNATTQSFVIVPLGTDIIASHEIKAVNETTQKIDLTVNGPYDYTWYKYNKLVSQYTTVGHKQDLQGALFPGKYYVQIRDGNGCFIYHEVFECDSAKQLRLAPVILSNLNPCDTIIEVEAEAKVLSGNPPYLYQWGNSAFDTIYKISVPKQVSNYQYYSDYFLASVKVVDGCGMQKVASSSKLDCDVFCNNDDIGLSHNLLCFDECDLWLEILCSKISSYSNNDDGHERIIDWGGTVGQTTTYIGDNYSIGEDVFYPDRNYANFLLQYTIEDKTTGCKVGRHLKLPSTCVRFKIWNWLVSKFLRQCPSCSIDDTDGDGVDNGVDNCPDDYNPDQSDKCNLNNNEYNPCGYLDCEKDECYNCKKEIDYAYSYGPEDCAIYAVCDESEIAFEIARGVSCDNDLDDCPKYAGNRIIREDNSFSCFDKFLSFGEVNDNSVQYFYHKNYSSNIDSLIGEKVTRKGDYYRTMTLPLNQNFETKQVVRRAYSDIIINQSITGIYLKYYNVQDSLYKTNFINGQYLKKATEGDEFYFNRENVIYKVEYGDNEALIEIPINDLPIQTKIFDIKENVIAYVTSNLITIKKGNQNVNAAIPSNFVPKDIGISNEGIIAMTGEFIGQLTLNGKIYDSYGNKNILILYYQNNGQLFDVFHEVSNGNQVLGSTTFQDNNVVYSYSESNTADGSDACTYFNGSRICPPPTCCTEFAGKLDLDTSQCNLVWYPYPNPLYTNSPQMLSDTGYVTVANASSPYDAAAFSGKAFRLAAVSTSCPTLYSDTIYVSCDTVAFCPANSIAQSWFSDSIAVEIDLIKNLAFDLRIDYFGYDENYSTYLTDSLFIPLTGSTGLNSYAFAYGIMYNMPSNPTAFVGAYNLSIKCPLCIDYCIIDSSTFVFRENPKTDPRNTASTIHVYPNPFSEGFTIDVSSPTINNSRLVITDVSGRLVYEDILPLNKGENRYVLKETQNWHNGFYQIHIQSDDSTIQHRAKIIKSE